MHGRPVRRTVTSVPSGAMALKRRRETGGGRQIARRMAAGGGEDGGCAAVGGWELAWDAAFRSQQPGTRCNNKQQEKPKNTQSTGSEIFEAAAAAVVVGVQSRSYRLSGCLSCQTILRIRKTVVPSLRSFLCSTWRGTAFSAVLPPPPRKCLCPCGRLRLCRIGLAGRCSNGQSATKGAVFLTVPSHDVSTRLFASCFLLVPGRALGAASCFLLVPRPPVLLRVSCSSPGRRCCFVFPARLQAVGAGRGHRLGRHASAPFDDDIVCCVSTACELW